VLAECCFSTAAVWLFHKDRRPGRPTGSSSQHSCTLPHTACTDMAVVGGTYYCSGCVLQTVPSVTFGDAEREALTKRIQVGISLTYAGICCTTCGAVSLSVMGSLTNSCPSIDSCSLAQRMLPWAHLACRPLHTCGQQAVCWANLISFSSHQQRNRLVTLCIVCCACRMLVLRLLRRRPAVAAPPSVWHMQQHAWQRARCWACRASQTCMNVPSCSQT
jgi:hypothetical protein